MEASNDEPKQCVVPRVGKSAPQFCGKAVVNGSVKKVDLKDYKGKYVILLFFNEDFFISPPKEIIDFIRCYDDFHQVNSEIIACSTESVHSHLAWITVQRKMAGLENVKIILLSDKNSHISKSYGVYEESTGFCMHALFIIDRSGILKHITISDNKVDASVNEIKRIVYNLENLPLPADPQKKQTEPDDLSLYIPKKPSKELFVANISDSQNDASKVDKIKDSNQKTFKKSRGKTIESVLEDNRPTELRVNKRSVTSQKIQSLSRSNAYKVLSKSKVPSYLLNGLRLEIDITDKSNDSFEVYTSNKMRASFVKPTNGSAHVLFTENCSVKFTNNTALVQFINDQLSIEVSRSKNDTEITIDQLMIKRKVQNNLAFFSIEATSNYNHILNVNGNAVKLKATADTTAQRDTTDNKEIYDYTEIREEGNKFIYYRKFKE